MQGNKQLLIKMPDNWYSAQDRQAPFFHPVICPIVRAARFYLIHVSLRIPMKFDQHTKGALLEQKYLTGSMNLITPNHSFKSCRDLEAFISTIIYKKCGRKKANQVDISQVTRSTETDCLATDSPVSIS